MKVGDRIMWAGHKCTVTAVSEPCRERYQHRLNMRVSVSVPGLPPRENLSYHPGEWIETWDSVATNPKEEP